MMSRIPTPSLSRTSTINSISTAVPMFGVLDLTLSEICQYVDAYSSLQAAEIVCTECYAERAGAVLHRFIILELRRENRKNVWLRLDRRRGKGVSMFQFLATAGITKANDRVRTVCPQPLHACLILPFAGSTLCPERPACLESNSRERAAVSVTSESSRARPPATGHHRGDCGVSRLARES